MKFYLQRKLIKLMAGPFVWANRKKEQTTVTRLIRLIWRSL